jgi:Putative amidoligase enzyme
MTKEPTLNELMPLAEMPPIKAFSKARPCTGVWDATLLYGVELEIESAGGGGEWVFPGITITTDGSLRNEGREFITSPMTFSNLHHCLERFFKKSGVTAANYSERCSVHVHTNCRDLTLNQIKGLCLLYQVFERLFYKYAGADRDKNIFCTPWNQTMLSQKLLSDDAFLHKLRDWQKYTGLNLLPLRDLGTVEWRHLPGTPDLEMIMNWCRLIGCLYRHVRDTPLEAIQKSISSLNSNSQYEQVLFSIFRDLTPLIWNEQNSIELLEAGVLDVKLLLLRQEAQEAPREVPRNPFLNGRVTGMAAPPLRAARTTAQIMQEIADRDVLRQVGFFQNVQEPQVLVQPVPQVRRPGEML